MNIEQINLVSNRIIKYKNLIKCLQEELNSDSEYINYGVILSGFGYFGNSIGIDELKEITHKVESEISEGKENVQVTINHTQEYADSWSEWESDVTKVEITGDVIMTDEEIQLKKTEKLAEIERLENEIKRLEVELKELCL